jgi:hypothetical protein
MLPTGALPDEKQVSHGRMRTTSETRGIHLIVMDDVKRATCLLLLVAEIEHPMTAIHDLPAPLNERDRGAIQIESQTILAHLWIICDRAERAEARER